MDTARGACQLKVALSCHLDCGPCKLPPDMNDTTGTDAHAVFDQESITLGILAFLLSWIVQSFFASMLLNLVDAVFMCYAMDRDTQVSPFDLSASSCYGKFSHGSGPGTSSTPWSACQHAFCHGRTSDLHALPGISQSGGCFGGHAKMRSAASELGFSDPEVQLCCSWPGLCTHKACHEAGSKAASTSSRATPK